MKKEIIEKVAKSYCKLLKSIDWKDEVIILGLREGLNKFLSNAFLRLDGRKKYHQGDFYSKEAAKKIKLNKLEGLVYEHMIPKEKYIQKPCEEEAKNKKLVEQFIIEKLKKYWKIAIITKEENKNLRSSKIMPDSWNGNDIHSRYNNIKLELISVNELNEDIKRILSEKK